MFSIPLRFGLACMWVAWALSVSARAGVIPVVVDRVLPDARPGAPVKFGVPFPRGALKVGERAQVKDDRGAVVPSQTRVTATWDPKGDQGVRWLLVDFLADTGRQYRVVYGSDLVADGQAEPPIAEVKEGRIALNTGPLTGTIATNKAELFGGLSAAGQPVVLPDAGQRFSAFFVEHETRGLFRSDLDPAPVVVLEETGPIRATVKLDGWYANAAGETFCRYSIRAHFFRGRADVKLDHTFIYTGVSTNDRIRAMGLQLPQKTGQRIHLWGEGERQNEMVQILTSDAKVVQDSPNHDLIELLHHPSDGGVPKKLAGRAMGTINSGSITAAIRDAWQQYPWGFEVREGVLQVQLWPRGERLLDTSFDGYWWFLDERQKRFMLSQKRGAKDESPDDWIARFRRVVNATGAAKTHEVWLSFEFYGPGGRRSEMSTGLNGGKLMREVNHPVIACADPAWSTATRALDFCAHTPRNDALFGDEERYLDAFLAMVRQITEASHWYGWWDWGGYYQLPGRPRGAFRDTHGLEGWHRNRPKSHYGWGQLLWLQYFRTGDRQWLRYGQTYTLYSADRAHVHHGRSAGAEYHYDNSEIPWLGGYVKPGGPETSSNLQQKDDYVYLYWLTGDRHALDVLETWGAQLGESPSVFKWAPGMARGNDIRNAGMQLHRLMMLYQATWDERILKIARGVADSFAVIDSEKEVILAEGERADPNYAGSRFHTAGGWAYEGLWLYYNVTGDERIKKTLLAFIERSKNYDGGIGGGYGPIRAYTYGYELTGDELYLDMIRGVLDDVTASWVSAGVWGPGGKFTVSTLGRALGTLASAPQAWRDKHLPTNVRGRTLRFGYVPRDGDAPPGKVACFNETQDRPWRFRLLFSHGGKWVLSRPDGTPAFTSGLFEEPFDTKWIDVQVPADGQTGTYTLRCVEPSKAARELGWSRNADARVLRSDLPVVVGLHDVHGRALFLRPTQAPAQVRLVPTDAVPTLSALAPRVFGLYADGKPVASTAGLLSSYEGAYRLPIPADLTGRLLELRPDMPADRYFADAPGDHTVHRYGASLEFDGGPPYVAANPGDYFVPDGRK